MRERTDLKEFATDAEVHDLILASPGKLGETALADLARSRGIFMSPDDKRIEVADYLSWSLRDFSSMADLVERTAAHARTEKSTTVVLKGEISQGEISASIREYRKTLAIREKVSLRNSGDSRVFVDLEYEVPDHGRTRLLQTQKKDMHVEFNIEKDQTTVTLPSNFRADAFIGHIELKLKTVKGHQIAIDRFTIAELNSEERIDFFSKLIESIKGYRFVDLLHVSINRDPSLDADGLPDSKSSGTDISEIKRIVLSGKRIASNQIYKSIDPRKFLISEVTFVVENSNHPKERFKIVASFSDISDMSGFDYGIWYAAREPSSDYSQFVKASSLDSRRMSELLIAAARQAKADILLAASQAAKSPRKAAKRTVVKKTGKAAG